MKFKESLNNELNTGQWKVTVEDKEWDKYIQKAISNIKMNINIPGFRKGKAPASKIKAFLTSSRILKEAHALVLPKAYDFAFKQPNIKNPFSRPTVEIKEINLKKYIAVFNFSLQPNLKIEKYTGFNNIKKTNPTVSKKEIDMVLKQYQNQFAMLSIKKEPAAMGDQVNINFKGYINNTPFAGGEAKKMDIELGAGQLILGFEENLVGMKVNETKKIEVVFPKDYIKDDLQNKKAEFVVKINDVKNKVLPKVDIELIKDLNLPNVKTVAQLKSNIKNDLLKQKNKSEKEAFIDNVLREIAKTANLSLPKDLVFKEMKKLKEDFKKELTSKKMTIEQYKKQTGYKDANIEEELMIEAQSRIENSLIFSTVLEKETFEPTKDIIDAKYKTLSDQFKIDVAEITKMLPEANLVKQIKEEMLIDFLYNNNGQDVKTTSNS